MGYERELKRLKSCIKLKGVLMSEDGGKTWFIYRQDHVTHAHSRYGRFELAYGVNLTGLPLKTDFEGLKEVVMPPLELISDAKLDELSVHDQLVYKIGVILHIIGFDELQLDLPSKLYTPPFLEIEKRPFKVRDKEYDVKGIYRRELYVFEVHHRGSLVETLVKLNSLDYAWRGLVLVNNEVMRSLKKELMSKQFRDLVYELRVFFKDEIEMLYNYCKAHRIDEEEKENIRKTIFEKPTLIEQVLQ